MTIKPLVKLLNVKRADKRKPTMNERIHQRVSGGGGIGERRVKSNVILFAQTVEQKNTTRGEGIRVL